MQDYKKTPAPLTETELEILDLLKRGSIIYAHISPDNRKCYRVADKDRNPLVNISCRTMNKLIAHGRVRKNGQVYVIS